MTRYRIKVMGFNGGRQVLESWHTATLEQDLSIYTNWLDVGRFQHLQIFERFGTTEKKYKGKLKVIKREQLIYQVRK